MGGACDRIFGDPDLRGEVAADEIHSFFRRSSRSHGRDPLQIQRTQERVVGHQRANIVGAFVNGDIRLSGPDFDRDFSNRLDQLVRWGTGFRAASREVHDDQSVFLCDFESPASGMENKRVHGITEMPKENVGRRKRGMTAQVDFAHRREPSQVKS